MTSVRHGPGPASPIDLRPRPAAAWRRGSPCPGPLTPQRHRRLAPPRRRRRLDGRIDRGYRRPRGLRLRRLDRARRAQRRPDRPAQRPGPGRHPRPRSAAATATPALRPGTGASLRTRASPGWARQAERGGYLPPVTLPRRMWAGGRVDKPDPPHRRRGERRSRILRCRAQNRHRNGENGASSPYSTACTGQRAWRWWRARHHLPRRAARRHAPRRRDAPRAGGLPPPRASRQRRCCSATRPSTFNGHRITTTTYATIREGYQQQI